jgi:hypothetical protein
VGPGDGEIPFLKLILLDDASRCREGPMAGLVRFFLLRFVESFASFHALCGEKAKRGVLSRCGS